MDARWVPRLKLEPGPAGVLRVREVGASPRRLLSVASQPLQDGESAVVGREARLAVGIDPPDTGVSRRALTVTAATDGWELTITNRHGAWLHPWGQPAVLIDPDTTIRRVWPRIGLRLVGGNRAVEHWVLLEHSNHPTRLADREMTATTDGSTSTPERPLPLTAHQRAAVWTVFHEHLAWPPIPGASPRSLAAAAARLKISEAGVRERLRLVQQRAYTYGLHKQIGVSDPDYVYLLVRHGFFDPPSFSTEEPASL